MEMEDFKLGYHIGRRDEIAALLMLIRAGGIKYGLEWAIEVYKKLDDNINPHVDWVEKNIDKLKP